MEEDDEKNEVDDSELSSILGGDSDDIDMGSNANDMDFIKDFIDEDTASVAKKASFGKIQDAEVAGKSSAMADQGNMSLLLDVQMRLTVELGRTSRSVKDILSLNVGSVLELDKLSGEPVDLLVNGKIIAKAEVVVIDENFGVRITEIVVPKEKMILEM